MTRPLRLQFPGALYHVTSRGDRRERIYCDDTDRIVWLNLLGQACDRYNFLVYSFCQMGNHYHILLETAEGNLSQGMRHLNGIYTQYFNRRHKLVGHLFQGRYKAILVQKESYLLELARYVVLNPLRAGMVRSLNDWIWSSHHFVVEECSPPKWLDRDTLLVQFGASRNEAIQAYCAFVMAGLGVPNPLMKTCHDLLLGSDEFVARHHGRGSPDSLPEIAKTQRRALALPLKAYQTQYPSRDEAMARAYLSTAYSMSEIARHFHVSYKTVSRALASFEGYTHRA